jgi:outer membrane lipoprotein SlyB
MNAKLTVTALAAVLALGACTTIPTGPSEMALPGTGRSFDQFRADDADCRQFATSQSGGATANQAAADSTAKSAALGLGVGALAGAAIGGGRGAGTGAGLGLIAGTVAGASAGNQSSWALQQRYDAGYKQCMYAKGHKVPVYGNVSYGGARPAAAQPAAAPPAALIPPPPPR